jgi:hypothetical protein
MIFAREAGAALVLVTLTLSLQCTGIAVADFLCKSQFVTCCSQIRADPFRDAHGAIDDCVHRLARIRDPARGTDVRCYRHRHGRRQSWSQDSPVDLAAVERELLNSGTWPPGQARPRSFDISLVLTVVDRL